MRYQVTIRAANTHVVHEFYSAYAVRALLKSAFNNLNVPEPYWLTEPDSDSLTYLYWAEGANSVTCLQLKD